MRYSTVGERERVRYSRGERESEVQYSRGERGREREREGSCWV